MYLNTSQWLLLDIIHTKIALVIELYTFEIFLNTHMMLSKPIISVTLVFSCRITA